MCEDSINPPPPYTEGVAPSAATQAHDEECQPTPTTSSPETSVGGLNLGSKVLGFGYGSNVSGSGIKVGPLMLGLVDANQTEKEDTKPAGERAKGYAA